MLWATTRVVKLELLFEYSHFFFALEFNPQYLFLKNLNLLTLDGSCKNMVEDFLKSLSFYYHRGGHYLWVTLYDRNIR